MSEGPTDILLVEHDRPCIERIRGAFSDAGMDVQWRQAGTLAEARQALEQLPDMMLLASDLPDGFGEELLPGLFSKRRFPIILMTKQSDDEEAVRSIKLGALHYIVKSEAALDALPETVRQVLREWRLIERHRMTTARLQASEARFRHFLENLRDIAFMLDAEGNITYANREAGNATGVPAAKLIGTPFRGYLSERDQHKAYSDFLRVMAGETVETEVEFSGRSFFSFKSEPLRNEGGDIVGAFGIGRDISEQRKAYLAVEESEQKLKVIVEAMVDGVLVADAGSQRFVNANAAICRMLGYSEEELMRLSVGDIHPRDGLANVLEQFARQLKGEVQVAQELPVQRKDGSLFYADISSAPLTMSGKKYMVGVFHDVTVRRQKAAKIRLLSSAIEQIDEAVVITNREGVIEYINSAFSDITGYEEAEVIGRNPRVLSSGIQGGQFYHHMWDALKQGDSWRGRIVNRRKDGSFYPCLLTISPIQDGDGQVSHFVGIQQNLKSYEDLEAQFHQSQKMEAVGALVGGIAHDFNNSLAGIVGNIYLAHREMGEESGARKRLDAIETLAGRAAGMIRHLLTFSRKGETEMQPLMLGPFVKEVIKLQRVSVPESIELQLDASKEALEVNGDANLLQQVIINLVNNARDALEETRKPIITIRLAAFASDEAFEKRHSQVSDSHFVALSVSDNGPGIPAEYMEHIFEPFFTTKGVGKGTGLGLSMAYGAAQAHGGAIEVESLPGMGATFTLYLPRLDVDGESIQQARKARGHIEQGSGETILLADDHADLLAMGREILEHLGYRVLLASNGEEAVEVYRRNKESIGLLLFDVVMPKMGGVEAFRIIQADDPGVKVLFSTGYDMENALDGAHDIDNTMVITKPFAISKLSQIVHKRLQG